MEFSEQITAVILSIALLGFVKATRMFAGMIEEWLKVKQFKGVGFKTKIKVEEIKASEVEIKENFNWRRNIFRVSYSYVDYLGNERYGNYETVKGKNVRKELDIYYNAAEPEKHCVVRGEWKKDMIRAISLLIVSLGIVFARTTIGMGYLSLTLIDLVLIYDAGL